MSCNFLTDFSAIAPDLLKMNYKTAIAFTHIKNQRSPIPVIKNAKSDRLSININKRSHINK